MAVIGVMAVTIVIGLTVAAVTMNSLSFTVSTRAGVQAQAAAEAGVDSAVASLTAGACTTPIAHPTVPAFTTVIQYSLSASGDTWLAGCPGSDAAKRVRIVSTGTAAARGVIGNTTGDTRRVEAVYARGAWIEASGPAIYSYGSSGSSASAQLSSVNGSKPSIQVRKGDVNCSSSGAMLGDVVVADGNYIASSSCRIGGTVWASKDATMSTSAIVDGNIVAKNLDMSSSARVGGDGWIYDTATFGSSASMTGHLTTKKVTGPEAVLGGVLKVSPNPGTPPYPAPFVPDWVDFDYQKSDWIGFDERVITGACNRAAFQAAADGMTGPGIIDARACAGGVVLSASEILTLNNDLVILAKSFDLSSSAAFASATDRKLWLITPDDTSNGLPSCVAPGHFTMGSSFRVGPRISAMIYTPCGVSASSSAYWRGQIFGGVVDTSSSLVMDYVQVGLPGVNLSTGASTRLASLIGARIATRDVG
jgi:hypothetical protein